MITNIVLTVVTMVVTNVSNINDPVSNTVLCNGLGYVQPMTPDSGVERTELISKTVGRFNVDGKGYEVELDSKLLSSTQKRWQYEQVKKFSGDVCTNTGVFGLTWNYGNNIVVTNDVKGSMYSVSSNSLNHVIKLN